MAKIKINCPRCRAILLARESSRGHELKCPDCKHSFRVPSLPGEPVVFPRRRRSRAKIKLAVGVLACVLLALVIAATALWFAWPARLHWPDRRPIGELFLASDGHTSATNPRGWFNDDTLDVTGPGGAERFRAELRAYTDRSLAILKKADAQGVIVWDLEGEQFPHKTTFIGDPRQLNRLAPEMDVAADEFFARLRAAGLKVGVTIRPQRLVFAGGGVPHQQFALNLKKVLEAKMDYARKRWGCTLFYVDSNYSFWRPDELWQLRCLAAEHPGVLLIPEHHWLPYFGFTAPYATLRRGQPAASLRWAGKFFPHPFQALDISDAAGNWNAISAAHLNGDVLLFRAWYENPEGELLEKFAGEEAGQTGAATRSGHPQ